MKSCIFCKIRDGEIPKEFDYEDEDVMVFPDINPYKPIHILVVPKKHTEDFLDFNDKELSMKVKKIIDKEIKKHKLDKKGYRVAINGGGAQLIDHVHFHVTGPVSRESKM